MSDYTISTTVRLPYEAAVGAVRGALTDQGFGILTEIDLHRTLKDKLDVEVPRQVILGACRPPLAYAALQVDASVAALLPCNVVVRALDETSCMVEAFDPAVMKQVGGEAMAEVAEDAGRRLGLVLAAVGRLGEDR